MTDMETNNEKVVPSNIRYFKLPYTGKFSQILKLKINKIVKKYCNSASVRIVFQSFKIKSLFSAKDPLPFHLKSCVVYKFQCAGCNACYIGETTRHITTRY